MAKCSVHLYFLSLYCTGVTPRECDLLAKRPASFCEELDMLLFNLPRGNSPHLDCDDSQAADLLALLFDFKLPTHPMSGQSPILPLYLSLSVTTSNLSTLNSSPHPYSLQMPSPPMTPLQLPAACVQFSQPVCIAPKACLVPHRTNPWLTGLIHEQHTTLRSAQKKWHSVTERILPCQQLHIHQKAILPSTSFTTHLAILFTNTVAVISTPKTMPRQIQPKHLHSVIHSCFVLFTIKHNFCKSLHSNFILHNTPTFMDTGWKF